MADRTVTTRLVLGVSGWTAGKNTVKRDLTDLNVQFKQTSGFASGFRKSLEDAVKRLPAIEIDANSTEAEATFAKLRGELEKLSQQEIGVDVDAVEALAELDRLKHELAELEDGASFEIRAGIQQAIADMELVAAEARRLSGQDVKIEIDADTKKAVGDLAKLHLGLLGLGTAVPVVAGVAAAAGILQGALFSAGAGVKAFGAVATATFERVQEAVDSQDYSKLSPEEFQLAQQWQTFSDVYLKWQQSVNPSVVPAISGGLGLMEKALPKISPLVAGTAQSFVGLEQRADAALNGSFWTKFLTNVGVAAPRAVTGLGNSLLNVGTGVAGIIDAFLPWQPTVVGGLEDATAKFSAWGQTLSTNQQFQEFMAYVEQHAPEAWQLVKNLAGAVGNVGEAVLPLGVSSMSGLNLLASIVAGMDPEHIRLIALAIIGIKTAQSGLAVASFWTDMTGKLDNMSRSADGAKGKMAGLASSMASGAGIVALAAGAVIGLDALGDELAGLNPDIDELARRMADLAAKGAPASQMLREFGSNADTFAGDLGRSSVLIAPVAGQFEQLSDTVSRLTTDNGLIEFGNDVAQSMSVLYSVDTGRQRLENFDKTLTAMVKAGNTEEAARQFDELARQSGLSGTQLDKLKSLLPGYSGAVAAAQQATAPTGDALKDLGTSASTAAGNVDSLRGAIGQLVGLTSNAMTAEIDYKRAIDDATASVKTNGEATSTNTEKGRANRETLIGLAEKANAYRDALIEQGTPLDEVTAKLGAQRDQFLQVAEKMGFSRTEAKKLAEQLGLIPGNVSTDVKTPGGKEAAALIKELQAKLNALDGKVVTATVKVLQDGTVKLPGGLKANINAAGNIHRYAAGGITAFAAGGMRPQPPALVSKPTALFGEGSSGQGATEAFIPYESRYRQRAVDLLGQVADDFGLEVYNRSAARRMSDAGMTIDATGMQVTTGLESAIASVEATLGQSGTLTGSIDRVGAVGDSLVAGWTTGSQTLGESVTAMGATLDTTVSGMAETMEYSIGDLTASVDYLGSVVVAAQEQMTSSTSTSSKSSSSKSKKSKASGVAATATKADQPRGKAGAVSATAKKFTVPRNKAGAVGATAEKFSVPRNPGGLVDGDYGLGGFVSAGASALSTANTSRVSAPQTAPPSLAFSSASQAGSSAAAPSGAGRAGGGVQVPITMNGLTVRQDADIPKIGSAVGFSLLSRGNV